MKPRPLRTGEITQQSYLFLQAHLMEQQTQHLQPQQYQRQLLTQHLRHVIIFLNEHQQVKPNLLNVIIDRLGTEPN